MPPTPLDYQRKLRRRRPIGRRLRRLAEVYLALHLLIAVVGTTPYAYFSFSLAAFPAGHIFFFAGLLQSNRPRAFLLLWIGCGAYWTGYAYLLYLVLAAALFSPLPPRVDAFVIFLFAPMLSLIIATASLIALSRRPRKERAQPLHSPH
jgi:hypothetical protein